MTFGSNWGKAAIFASNSSHAFIGKRCKQSSNGEGVITSRASPVAASTSRNRDGKLVRPFASIACSKCPRNMFPRPCLPPRGCLRHYLPLYPTMLFARYGGKPRGVNSLRGLEGRNRINSVSPQLARKRARARNAKLGERLGEDPQRSGTGTGTGTFTGARSDLYSGIATTTAVELCQPSSRPV